MIDDPPHALPAPRRTPAEQSPDSKPRKKETVKMCPTYDFDQKDGETTLVPGGRYEVIIRDSDFKTTRAGNEQLVLTVEILTAGEYAGCKISHPIMTYGSDAGVAFGKKKLSKVLKALGIPKIHETSELHDKPLLADVEIEISTGSWDDKNQIVAWYPLEGDGETTRAAPRRNYLSNGEPAPDKAAAAPSADALKDQAKQRFQQSMRSNNSTKPAEPDRRTTAQIVDEDIPF
jgi:hypothetical protein